MPAAPNSAASGSDWPQWHGPNRNNFTSENITWPAAGPKQLWTAAVGDGFSGISVSKGRAYTMGNSNDLDTVWCFDARTGAVVWKYSYPTPNQYKQFPGTFLGTRSTPTIDGPLVYTVSRTGSLFALDAAKGTVVWSADYFKDFHGVMPRWGFAGSPLVEGKLLIVNPGGKGASVVAFDKSTGQVVWKTGDEVANYASPVIVTVGGQRILAMMLSNGVHGYNLADGKELWKTPVSSKNSNGTIDDPVVLGDKLFLPEYDGNSYALYKVVGNSVEEVYVNKKLVTPGFPSIANAALIGGLLYGYLGPFDRPAMICLDPETGDMKWKKDKIGGPFLAAGNKLIYIRSETGKAITDTGKLVVAEASPDGYKEIGSTQALPEKTQCWTAPSLANGLVYCRNTKGDVVCLDLSGK
jgi:outer membrane protein assembly factor BamB